MENSQHYDSIVVGAGQGGGPLASALARAGRRTALIEREHVGGTCINYGLHSHQDDGWQRPSCLFGAPCADYGVESGPVRVDMAEVRRRKRAVVASFRSGSERQIEETPGLELIRGDARFTGPKALRVDFPDGRLDVTAAQIFLDVGTCPAPPSLSGIDRVVALDSTSIMELETVPEHLLVLGGGYVGLEFGQMFRRFGSRVTVVQRGQRLLGREDDDVADAIVGILREDGITVLLATEARAVAPGSGGGYRPHGKGANGEHVLAGSHLLTAAGRAPNTDRLALEKTGVETDEKGYITVDERLATNVPGIYALGDVTGGPAFTHISYDDFRILRTNLIDGGDATTSGRLVHTRSSPIRSSAASV